MSPSPLYSTCAVFQSVNLCNLILFLLISLLHLCQLAQKLQLVNMSGSTMSGLLYYVTLSVAVCWFHSNLIILTSLNWLWYVFVPLDLSYFHFCIFTGIKNVVVCTHSHGLYTCILSWRWISRCYWVLYRLVKMLARFIFSVIFSFQYLYNIWCSVLDSVQRLSDFVSSRSFHFVNKINASFSLNVVHPVLNLLTCSSV